MRRIIVFMLMVSLLVQPFPVLGTVNPENPQHFFKIDMTLIVKPVTLNESQVWMGNFKIYAHLVDPYYRAYFNELASKNETKAKEEFKKFVKSLIYENLRDDFEDKLRSQNLTTVIYFPQGGPVKLLDNWSAIVYFSMANFLIPEGTIYRSSVWGSLDFKMRGYIFDYSWDKLVLVLPKDYEINDLVPAPDEISGNVAIWRGGYMLPLIELRNPIYSLIEFLNSTTKEIVLVYDPHDGYVQFNATFSGASASNAVITHLLDTFRSTMDVTSIDAIPRNNSLVVVGVATPHVAYQETRFKKQWTAMLTLPGKFDKVVVVNGDYKLAPDNTIIITVIEKKKNYILMSFIIILLVTGSGILGYYSRKRRRGTKIKPSEGLPKKVGEV